MSEKGVIREAFTDLAPRYEQVVDKELKRFWGWGYMDFVDHILTITPFHDGDIVLDVATGTAVIPLKLIRLGTAWGEIQGLDITHAMLKKARRKIDAAAAAQPDPLKEGGARPSSPISLTCASAMAMPYHSSHFDVVLCALAAHHLDVPVVLAEMARVLKPGGRLAIADVIGSVVWQLPVISSLIRAATFVYFLPQEGLARARAESSALSNVYTAAEWEHRLAEAGFEGIQITTLPTSHSWLPSPLIIQAQKTNQEG
jgi:ubiquinone/menaquinone biosynthesis C-methylase UbiE